MFKASLATALMSQAYAARKRGRPSTASNDSFEEPPIRSDRPKTEWHLKCVLMDWGTTLKRLTPIMPQDATTTRVRAARGSSVENMTNQCVLLTWNISIQSSLVFVHTYLNSFKDFKRSFEESSLFYYNILIFKSVTVGSSGVIVNLG